MTDAVDHLSETALESPYADDRRDAVERLGDRVAAGVDGTAERRAVRTLSRVAKEGRYADERRLARETLVDLAGEGIDPDPAVEALARVAIETGRPDERREATDDLADVAERASDPEVRAAVRDRLATVAESDDMARNRERARERLTELDALPSTANATGGGSDDYLGVSLAEHLERAAAGTAADCRRRAAELRDFVASNPVDDDAHADVEAALEDLVAQLDVLPDDADLDDERRERVTDVADRARRLYVRS